MCRIATLSDLTKKFYKSRIVMIVKCLNTFQLSSRLILKTPTFSHKTLNFSSSNLSSVSLKIQISSNKESRLTSGKRKIGRIHKKKLKIFKIGSRIVMLAFSSPNWSKATFVTTFLWPIMFCYVVLLTCGAAIRIHKRISSMNYQGMKKIGFWKI